MEVVSTGAMYGASVSRSNVWKSCQQEQCMELVSAGAMYGSSVNRSNVWK